jgi:hypothetical protein
MAKTLFINRVIDFDEKMRREIGTLFPQEGYICREFGFRILPVNSNLKKCN